MKTIRITATALSICLLASGCASIMHGGSKTVRINSQPAGAKFTVYNQDGKAVDSEITPASVNLKRGRGMFTGEKYWVAFEAPGYRPGETWIESNVNGWFYGNIAFGGLVGMVIDGSTGAMWNLSPAEVNHDLVPAAMASNPEELKDTPAQADPSADVNSQAGKTTRPQTSPEDPQ